MTSAFSWQNSISLCLASVRIPKPNLPVTPQNNVTPYETSLIMKLTVNRKEPVILAAKWV